MNLLRNRPSPALAVSIVALVVAMGGTSYAAIQITSQDIKNNTIQSNDIKDKGVKGRDLAKDSMNRGKIKKNAVTSAKINDGTIKTKDIKPGVLSIGDTRWALVNAAGQIEAQSGGFKVEAAYPVLPNTAVAPAPDNSLRANGNVYIETNEPLTNNGIVATVALQNAVDQDGGGMAGRTPGADANAEFSGEIAVSMCGLPGTTCAPTGTNTVEYLVVSPRNSDGSVTTDGARKRFYVIITGDSKDYVAP